MTNIEIKERIIKTIDQFYTCSSQQHIDEVQLHYIGGILQTALHLVPTDMYFDIKQYIYLTYGYDPGGCAYGQMTMEDMGII